MIVVNRGNHRKMTGRLFPARVREREKEGSKWGWEREANGYIYGILMADREIKAEGFSERFCFLFLFLFSLFFGFGKMRERKRERNEYLRGK